MIINDLKWQIKTGRHRHIRSVRNRAAIASGMAFFLSYPPDRAANSSILANANTGFNKILGRFKKDGLKKG